MRDGRVLVLNQSFDALNFTDVQNALQLVHVVGSAAIVEASGEINTSSGPVEVPTVIRLTARRFVNVPRRNASWSKRGVKERDAVVVTTEAGNKIRKVQCKYCGALMNFSDATIDHIIPASTFDDRSKASVWNNTCACCQKCNARKADRTPERAGMRFIPGFEARTPRVNYLRITADDDPTFKKWIREK